MGERGQARGARGYSPHAGASPRAPPPSPASAAVLVPAAAAAAAADGAAEEVRCAWDEGGAARVLGEGHFDAAMLRTRGGKNRNERVRGQRRETCVEFPTHTEKE